MKTSHESLPDYFPESWADSFGQDDYGIWQGVYIEDIEIRFRWIPPGEFKMGSPGDGSAWKTGDSETHVCRGGSWISYGRFLRSAYRSRDRLGFIDARYGFRLARGPELQISDSGRKNKSGAIPFLTTTTYKRIFATR